MEKSIAYLKDQVILKGNEWKKEPSRELMRDCLALIQAINVLEHRLYGKEITDITIIM